MAAPDAHHPRVAEAVSRWRLGGRGDGESIDGETLVPGLIVVALKTGGADRCRRTGECWPIP